MCLLYFFTLDDEVAELSVNTKFPKNRLCKPLEGILLPNLCDLLLG